MPTRRTLLGRALLAALLLLPAVPAHADVAATGSFDITLSLTPPNVPFSGNIFFDGVERTALGRAIDLDTDVGDMTFEGDAVVNVAAESATFDLSAESDVDFQFTSSGAGSCETAGCVNGRGTFAGRFTTITDPSGLLPAGVYTFDGTAEINFSGQGPGGVFAVNAFPLTPTPVGTNVDVSSGPQTFFDTVANALRDFTATARFASVTGAGDTQFVAFSALPGDFPAGVNFNAMAALFVDVSTTATVTGGVRLCLSYPDANDDGIVDGTTNLTVPRLRLLYAATIGAPFTDVTVSAGNLLVCGDAPGPGTIAIGALPPGATTTTSTTSTTLPGATTSTSTTAPPGASTTTSTTAPGGSTTSTTVSAGGSTTTSIAVSPGGPTTTSTTLPVCSTALDCLDVAIAGPLCPGETLNQRLATVILKKLTKAQGALLATRSTSVAKKIAKLIGKAQKQLGKVATKADAFVSKPKGAISAGCRDRIVTAIGRVTQQIQANRI
jgi:hypothetical protein